MTRHSNEYDAEDSEAFELASLLPDGDEDKVLVASRVKAHSPLPKLQVYVLLVLYLAAPVRVKVRPPFIVELICGLNISPNDVGYHSGVLDSLCFTGEAISVLQWGCLSDKIGRRPVLFVCTLGLASALTSFGLSTTFAGLAVSRAFEGLLNGNSGTIKAILAELAGGDEHKLAKVFSMMPMVWAVGATIGPILGGSLANPAQRFPSAFSGSLWKEHPYLLACLSGATFYIIGFLAVFFYLKETLSTVEAPKHDQIGLPVDGEPEEYIHSSQPFWPFLCLTNSTFLTRRLVVTLVNYAVLSFLDSSLYATYPLLLASPITSGGLAFPPKTIGYILGIAALSHGMVQAFCFPSILKRWNTRNIYRTSMMGYMFMYIMMPVMNALARRAGRVTPVIWVLLILEEVAFFSSYSAYSCMYIFVSQASPSQAALGKTHGLGQTVSAVMAAIGPATSTSLIALSLQHNLFGGALGYIFLVVMCIVGLGPTSLLPAGKRVVLAA